MQLIKTLKYKLYITAVLLFSVTHLLSQNAYFIKNKGQVVNQNGQFNKNVAYLISLKDYNVSFYNDHFSYEVFSQDLKDSNSLNVERVELWFNDFNSSSVITSSKSIEDPITFYKNGKAFEEIQSFEKITYKNVWNGVDIEFQIQNNQLKYNYIVSNQKIKTISLTIKGADIKKENGDLILKTPNQKIKETIPESYFLLPNNEKVIEDVNIEVTKEKLTFNLPKNRKNTYIIDPIAYGNEYTSYCGGAHMDFAQNINTTKTKQVIVSGYTVSTNNIATTGSYQNTLADQDAFIAAFDNNGNRLWATYFGGEGGERIYSAALDSNDNIFIAGNSTSLIGMSTPGSYQQYISSGDDAFLSKFSSIGSLIWSSYYGGNAHELITSIALDDSNKVYVTGHTSSSDLNCTPNAFRNSINGYENAFLGVFDNNGNIIYNSYYVKGSNTRGEAIAITKNGTIYFSGYTNDTETITNSSVHQTQNNGYIEGFIIKLTPQYQMVWKTYFGGDHNDLIEDMAIDSLENIYLVGKTKSSIGIATANGFQTTYSNNWDGFVTKMDSSSTQLWGSYVHAGNSEEITSLELQDSTIWLLGITNGNGFPTNTTSLQENNNGGFDNLLINLSNNGGLLWSSYLGSTNDEFGYDITIDMNKKILITGVTGSNSNISTSNAHQTTYGGHIYDGFWTKLCKPLYPTVLSETGTINLCEGDTLNVLSTNNFNDYLWSDGTTLDNISISTSGKYVLKTLDNNNCPGRSDTLTITIIPSINLSLQQSNNAICYNDSVLLSIPPLYSSYLWSNGDTTATIYISDNQEYSLTVLNSYGCSYQSDSIQLPIAQYNYPIQLIGDTIICSGGEAILYSNGLNTINWSSSESTNSITVSTSGSYSFIGTDYYGCPAISDTISITQINYNSPALVLDTTSIFSICWNETIELIAENNFNSYLWSNGISNQVAFLNEEGYHYLSATDSNGCVGISDSILIEYKSSGVSLINLSYGSTFCEGDSLLITTQSNLNNILWEPTNQNSDSVYIRMTNDYNYSAIDSLGCLTYSDTISIIKNNLPNVEIIGGLDSICLDDSLYLTSQTNLQNYNWSNGNETSDNYQTFNLLGVQSIYLIGTDFNNCINKDSIQVNVIDCNAYDNIKEINTSVSLLNDLINIESEHEIEKISIYNLNGKLIYNKEKINSKNTTIASENIAADIYIITIKLENNSTHLIEKINLIK